MATSQKGLAIFNKGVGLGEAGAAGPHCFNFPAFQAQACLDVILDMVVVPRLAIFRNTRVTFAGFFVCLADGFSCPY
jgi:hypothetical protein